MPAGYLTDNESIQLLLDRVTILQKEIYRLIRATEQSDAPTSNNRRTWGTRWTRTWGSSVPISSALVRRANPCPGLSIGELTGPKIAGRAPVIRREITMKGAAAIFRGTSWGSKHRRPRGDPRSDRRCSPHLEATTMRDLLLWIWVVDGTPPASALIRRAVDGWLDATRAGTIARGPAAGERPVSDSGLR